VQAPTVARFAEAILAESREPARLERAAGLWMELSRLTDQELEERWESSQQKAEVSL
jgi:hypothetical protein